MNSFNIKVNDSIYTQLFLVTVITWTITCLVFKLCFKIILSINQSINQSVLFQAARPIHEKQRKDKTHKHTVVKQTDRQTDIKIMYNNMAGAACAVPLQEHCYMRTICY